MTRPLLPHTTHQCIISFSLEMTLKTSPKMSDSARKRGPKLSENTTKQDHLYRPCVGIMLLNDRGLVWIGRRTDIDNDEGSGLWWQMPQGGIDDNEDPAAAALRELYEETSVESARIIAKRPAGTATICRRTLSASPGADGGAGNGRSGMLRASRARTTRSTSRRRRPQGRVRRLAVGRDGRARQRIVPQARCLQGRGGGLSAFRGVIS